ncbi:MAG: sigma 54-interacting transcriptional regulator [Acidobacteriota bacterium]
MTATLEDLRRASPSLAPLLDGAERGARAGAPVLILGESGTGRSTLARALHGASPRSDGPLVEIDPGTVPSSLFESELFGYRRGAFSGADGDHAGRVAQARGGTLVLDHVEDLPLAVQPKLLRLLAERRYAPLGGTDTDADVRFVAIASDDLADRARRGAFRADLFYRLEVLAFPLPPLRRRRRDLPTLLDLLLGDLGERFGRDGLSLSPRARRWMEAYPWPGNLRQVRNVLERDLVIQDGNVLDPEAPVDAAEARPASLRQVEHDHILRTLAYTRGHQGKAAEILGISRKALWEKRKRLGIP